ncbi:ferredoxin [Mycobacterium sp. AT1]|uniref:ferredoxin n=1 Tax=Mycobacterium sp. AT1 TaxID=1961706 RepID=UPI0009AC561C|nr:ferredoxin [Mycobacterium sp. AT1]OPX13255.1 ferredoxin [Mycobacterium sp. AT1]
MLGHIEFDRDRCEGHGLCEQLAPEIFHLDDEGELELLVTDVPAELQAMAEAGTGACPVAALRISALQQR